MEADCGQGRRLTFMHDALLVGGEVIIAQDMEDAVRHQQGQLLIDLTPLGLGLAYALWIGDDNLAEEVLFLWSSHEGVILWGRRRVSLSLVVARVVKGEGQNIGGLVQAAVVTIQSPDGLIVGEGEAEGGVCGAVAGLEGLLCHEPKPRARCFSSECGEDPDVYLVARYGSRAHEEMIAQGLVPNKEF